MQVIDDDGSDAIEASKDSSWLQTRGAKATGQEVFMEDKGKGAAKGSITSFFRKLPLGE